MSTDREAAIRASVNKSEQTEWLLAELAAAREEIGTLGDQLQASAYLAKDLAAARETVSHLQRKAAQAGEREQTFREALEEVLSDATQTYLGVEPPAYVATVRSALAASGGQGEGKYGDWRDNCSGTGGNYGE